MTPVQFKALRLSGQHTQATLAHALDMKERMIRYYESGQRGEVIPKWLEYATKWECEK